MILKKGFILIEGLLAVIASFLVLQLLSLSLSQLTVIKDPYQITDLMNSLHLQRVVNEYNHIIITGQEMLLEEHYLNHDKQTLVLRNRQVYLTPGVNILFNNVDHFDCKKSEKQIICRLVRGDDVKKIKISI